MELCKKNIYKLNENDKAAFYSPAEEWVLLFASTKKPEEREFVADSGASMHIVSKRDLNSAELETMRTSSSPTTVMTANGEVQEKKTRQFFLSGSTVRIMPDGGLQNWSLVILTRATLA